MGGKGSGRQYGWADSGKMTTESKLRIDIRWLKKMGYLKPCLWGALSWSSRGKNTGTIIGYVMEENRMVLKYKIGFDNEQIEQVIHFNRTHCHLGGFRKWFRCPLCGKRVAVLYLGGKRFFCRYCLDLTYSCQQEQPADRLMRKARRIRARLGASGNLTVPIWTKPKNMHWKTFARLKDQADEANRLSWGTMAERFDC